ncbi:hypothetical protein [Bosea sp. BH3]|uniref:hypothetical protein n=1 Tax=Bosea sp. BH3 TaxID=2871701 RepID=UPI0021CB049E|nr:hypothetical protein [Bosea sp. BH3]MCU4179720.1 hypothetical protein [Bosea sp. BH3]
MKANAEVQIVGTVSETAKTGIQTAAGNAETAKLALFLRFPVQLASLPERACKQAERFLSRPESALARWANRSPEFAFVNEVPRPRRAHSSFI